MLIGLYLHYYPEKFLSSTPIVLASFYPRRLKSFSPQIPLEDMEIIFGNFFAPAIIIAPGKLSAGSLLYSHLKAGIPIISQLNGIGGHKMTGYQAQRPAG